MNKNAIFLIIGIILFILGGYQNIQYEENSLTVPATVTNVKTRDDTDGGPTTYKHTYYGEYEVDGKKYENVKLDTAYTSSYTPKYSVGDQLKIKVYPDNPDTKVPEGGIFLTVGLIMAVWNLVLLVKSKKAKEAE